MTQYFMILESYNSNESYSYEQQLNRIDNRTRSQELLISGLSERLQETILEEGEEYNQALDDTVNNLMFDRSYDCI